MYLHFLKDKKKHKKNEEKKNYLQYNLRLFYLVLIINQPHPNIYTTKNKSITLNGFLN